MKITSIILFSLLAVALNNSASARGGGGAAGAFARGGGAFGRGGTGAAVPRGTGSTAAMPRGAAAGGTSTAFRAGAAASMFRAGRGPAFTEEVTLPVEADSGSGTLSIRGSRGILRDFDGTVAARLHARDGRVYFYEAADGTTVRGYAEEFMGTIRLYRVSDSGEFVFEASEPASGRSFATPTDHDQSSDNEPTDRYTPTPTVLGTNVNSYFDEKFSIGAEEAFIEENETILLVTLNNLTEKQTKVLFSSGRSDRSFGSERYVPRPFLRDEQGNEYLAKQPTIRGEAEAFIFDHNGLGGERTIKVKLPPQATISGRMVFPRLLDSVERVTLVIPGPGGGWQSELVIPSISVSAKSPGNNLSESSEDSDLELIRLAPTASHTVNSQVVINRGGVAEEVSADGVPIGVSTVFHGNGRYDRTSREYVVYFAEFSGAVPERTLFEPKLSFNGTERPAFMHGCVAAVAKSRSGIFFCRTTGHYLRAGSWEIRLLIDGQEVHRIQYEIVPG